MQTTQLSLHHTRIISVAAAIVATGLLLFAGLSHNARAQSPDISTDTHIITLHDDGVDRGFMTKKSTLREALAEAKIAIDPRDRTEPELDEKLVSGSYEVNVYRARPVLIRDGAAETKVITSYRTGKQIAKEAKIILHNEDIATLSTVTDLTTTAGAPEVLTIKRALSVNFIFYGKPTTVYTFAKTVGEMLHQKRVTPTADDTVSPGLTTPITDGMKVELWKNGEQDIVVEEDIEFEVQKIQDSNKERGYREVKTPGVKGKKLVTYKIVMQNGKEVARQELKSVVTKSPTKQIEIVGAKNNYSGSLNEWLLALRTCETHGNYAANTGNGFYGAYQFMIGTWDNIARKTGRIDLVGIRPDLAAPADQDAMVIANANMTAGLSTQHPGCYTKLGLSNKPPL